MRSLSFSAIACWILAVVAQASIARAESKPVKPTKTWSGSVEDVALQKLAPAGEYLTRAEDFEKLAKAWKIAEKLPAVDFTKELVLVATTSGSRLNLSANLDDQGDLKILGIATRDFGPGFRYVVQVIPRDGIKTVGGKPLP